MTGIRASALASCATLLLALSAPAWAQNEPWRAEKLDLAAINADLEKWKADLKEPAKDASDEDKKRFAVQQERVRLLTELSTVLKDRDLVAQPDDSETKKTEFDEKLAALRKQPPDPVPEVQEQKQLAPLEKDHQTAKSALDADASKISQLNARLKVIEDLVKNASARRTELRAAIERLASAKAGTTDAIARANAELEERYLKEVEALAPSARKRIEAVRAATRAEHDYEKEVLRRADERLKGAREKLKTYSDAAAERQAKSAAEAKKRAENLKDPVFRFRDTTLARIDGIQSDIKKGIGRLSELKSLTSTEKKRLERYNAMRDREVESVGKRDLASATAKRQHDTLLRIERARHTIEAASIPRNDKELQALLGELGPLQDEYWVLDGPRDEMTSWNELVETLQELQVKRLAEARSTFDDVVLGPKGLKSTVLARINSLEELSRERGNLTEIYRAQAKSLAKIEALIRSRIYWVRTEPPLGKQVVDQGWNDLKRLWTYYTEPEFVGRLQQAVMKQPGVMALASLVLIALLIGTALGARRLRMRPMERPANGKRLRSAVRDALRVLFHAAAPSIVLFGAAAILDRVELPERVSFPILVGLRSVGKYLFFQRLAWGLLRDEGYLIHHFKVRPEVGRAVLRSIRIVTMAAMLFHVPELVLKEAPFEEGTLIRLFGTVSRTAVLVAIALLLPRRGPVVDAFVAGSPAGKRLIGVLNPVFFGIFAMVFVMDILGYQYGAIYFNRRILDTFIILLVVRGAYAALNQVSDRVVARVRDRAYAEIGTKAADEDSEKTTRQLSRLITTAAIVATIVVLSRSWDVGTTTTDVLSEWQLMESRDGVFLTMKDVVHAILFIIAAHFISANIGGIFELVVFPIFGNLHRGTRFVILALSRYAILLVGYTVALISLHFTVANIGWLLTAVSVGLGFGMQEIVANFVSGLILLVEQPVRVGDIVTVGETAGTVEKITIRSTVVTNWDQQQIIIPNKQFIVANVTNWTRNNTIMRRGIDVSVEFGSNIEQVLSVLSDVATSHPSVKKFPAPRIWFNGFGDSGIQIRVWVYTDISDGLSTLSELRQTIHDRFLQEGIVIPFPQRDIHIRTQPGDKTEELQAHAGMLEQPSTKAETEEDEETGP
ncbi:MAG: mechanosensitive ion channel domain-containing protein [Planctomycetota bacterium]